MKRLGAALLLLLAAPAAAQPIETVVVNANALVGLWKIGMPTALDLSLFHGTTPIGPMRDHYCRINQAQNALTVRCLGVLNTPEGTVTVEGAHIHLAWGVMLARLVIDGPLQSASSFAGTFTFKLTGISHDAANVSTGTNLLLSAGPPDKAGKSALLKHLLDEMAQGPPGERLEAQNKSDVQIPAPETLRALGAVQGITYLGEIQHRLEEQNYVKGQPPAFVDFLSAYDVEFAGGQRICGLHQRDDGVIDGFRCA